MLAIWIWLTPTACYPRRQEARDKRIFELWMACYTGAEIAAQCGCDEKTVTNVVSGISEGLPDFQKPAANHLTDFDVPIYNVWKQQEKEVISSETETLPEATKPAANRRLLPREVGVG